METFWQDLRYGARMLGRNRGFTAVAVLALALGIGANSAIFSVVNALLLSPLPYPDADRLVVLWNRFPEQKIAQDWLSPGQYLAIKTQSQAFEDVAIALGRSYNLTGQGTPERVEGLRVSASLLPLLGARPTAGRVFLPEEDEPGKPPVAIISHDLWQRRFDSDPSLVGKAITLDGQPFTVVGVLPAGFALDGEVMPTVGGVARADALLPMRFDAQEQANHGSQNFNVLARLKPGVTAAQAQAEMNTIAARLMREEPSAYPPDSGFAIGVVPALDQVVGDVRPALLVLLGSVGFVLLISCANVANLLLSRAAAREKEMAIRTAMGAGRLRLIRQTLTESILLALVGGALGLLLGVWSVEGLRLLRPEGIPRLDEIAIDAGVLAFTFGISLLTGAIFGLAPALRASRTNLNDALKDAARDSTGGAQSRRLRDALVVSEVALSLVLLTGAGLLIRSFMTLQAVDPGFAADNVLSLRLTLPGAQYSDAPTRAAFFRQIVERIENLPGVESAGAASVLPLAGGVGWGGIEIENYVPTEGEGSVSADQRVVSAGYFETMRIPLRSGRFLTDQDTADAPRAVVVDENLARRFWPGEDPVGKRLRPGGEEPTVPWATIVGVVGDVKQYALDTESRITVYYSHPQAPRGGMYLVARTGLDPASAAGAVAGEVRAMDPNLPVSDVKTMDQRLSDSLARRRFSMLLLGLFAGVALLLAAIGIYGVMSYSVAQRTHEMGIRIALGAGRRDVLRLVVGQGMSLALLGVGAGLVAAFGLTRLMASLLFGVSATDPLTFAAIATVLIGVALAASLVPARRATKVDPMVALRYE